MSSFFLKARNKQTGNIENFTALDDYFGKNEYGYRRMGDDEFGSTYNEEEFNRLFEIVK